MGRSRGGLTTKIHALVDADGRPVRLALTAGQAGDAPAAGGLLEDLSDGATLFADRAYDTPSAPSPRSAAPGPTSRLARSGKTRSASAAGFTARET